MIKRHPQNPIIRIDDLKPSFEELKVVGVFNPAACRMGNETILLARVAEACEPEEGWLKVPIIKFKERRPGLEILSWKENGPHSMEISDPRKYLIDGRMYLTSISHLRLARSRDGVHFTFSDQPFLFPATSYESFGVEDARITRIKETFYITYTVVSGDGYGVGLASTQDFDKVERHGMILPPPNKDTCIFPEKINNYYVALHRPIAGFFSKPSIWYAESPDLLHWSNHSCLLRPKDNRWEYEKIGAGPQPIKTSEGWLLLYHGCGYDSVYSLHLCLLDLEEPRRVLKRGNCPILTPEDEWEKSGFFPNVVFSNGWIEHPDRLVQIYYGAADECICLAETTVNDLLKSLR